MAFDSTEQKWSDLEVFINGVRIAKVNAIRENPTQETEYIYGADDEPLDIQTGNRAYPGSISLKKSQIDVMNKAAIAAGGRDLMDIPWTIACTYKPTMVAPRQTTTYPNVRIEGYEAGMEQGAKEMIVALPYKSLRPIRK